MIQFGDLLSKTSEPPLPQTNHFFRRVPSGNAKPPQDSSFHAETSYMLLDFLAIYSNPLRLIFQARVKPNA